MQDVAVTARRLGPELGRAAACAGHIRAAAPPA